RRVADGGGRLAQAAEQFRNAFDDLRCRGFGWNDLDTGHPLWWIEPMGAQESLGPSEGPSQEADRNRGRVGGRYGVLRRRLLDASQHVGLERWVFRDGLDDEGGTGDRLLQRRRRADPIRDRRRRSIGHQALRLEALGAGDQLLARASGQLGRFV